MSGYKPNSRMHLQPHSSHHRSKHNATITSAIFSVKRYQLVAVESASTARFRPIFIWYMRSDHEPHTLILIFG
jgi:hypothetical protein